LRITCRLARQSSRGSTGRSAGHRIGRHARRLEAAPTAVDLCPGQGDTELAYQLGPLARVVDSAARMAKVARDEACPASCPTSARSSRSSSRLGHQRCVRYGRSTKPRRLGRRTVAYENRDSLVALADRPSAAYRVRAVAGRRRLQQGRHARLLSESGARCRSLIGRLAHIPRSDGSPVDLGEDA